MFARLAIGAVLAGTLAAPAFAEQMGATEARRFVANKMFSFTCFDGTKGAGRIFNDGSAAGSVQFGGNGPVRHMRLPTNTLQVRGDSICAAVPGLPFSPCFNLNKYDEVSFRGAVSGLGFAYCDFHREGRAHTYLTKLIRRPRSLRPPEQAQAKAMDKPAESVRSEPVAELRKSQD